MSEKLLELRQAVNEVKAAPMLLKAGKADRALGLAFDVIDELSARVQVLESRGGCDAKAD